MTDYKKAFVDTAPFIYFIEKNENNPQYYDKVKNFFKRGYETDKKFVTSVITMENILYSHTETSVIHLLICLTDL